MEQSENTKVYKFNLCQYKKHNLKKLILSNIFIFLLYSIYLMFIFSIFEATPFVIYLGSTAYIAVFIVKVIKDFSNYFHAEKKYKDDNITIKKENGDIVNIKVHMTDNKYNEYYSIKSISELDRKTHIKIEGEFYAKSAHSLLKDKTSTITYLRIPPYFDNMDEIYKELEKMKEQEQYKQIKH